MHYMVDIETLGTTPGSAILSVAFAQFALRGKLSNAQERHYKLNVSEQLVAGAHVDSGTLAWWSKQASEAKAPFSNSASFWSLADCLTDIASFVDSTKDNYWWANSPQFDFVLLEAMQRHVAPHVSVPWSYRNTRDVRTVCHMCDFDPRTLPFSGNAVAHDALADARQQARVVRAALAQGLNID